MSGGMKYPTEDAMRMSQAIAKMANDLDVAVLAVLWDKKPHTAGILIAENTAGGNMTDGRGGFRDRFCFALLSQDDLCESMLRCATEAMAGRNCVVEQAFAPKPRAS